MAEGVNKMRLFGGVERSLAVQVERAEAAEAFERPLHEVSAKSRRLGGLPPHLRELTSPWFAGAVAHSERYGATVQTARVAVLVALGALSLCILLCVGLVWLSVTYADVRVVPYIVQADSHGYVVPIGPAERAAPLDARLQMAAVAQWVLALRRVTGDPGSQRTFIETAFFFLAPEAPATQKVREWYAQRKPMESGVKPTSIEIVRVAPLESGRDFSIEWTEETPGNESEPATKSMFSAVVSVVLSPTQKLQDVIRNPAGVYIRDFSVSKLQ
jgi:type IV secretion system protein VirB5